MSRTKDQDLHTTARQAAGVLAVLDSKPIDDEVQVGVQRTKGLQVVDAATYARAGEYLTGFASLVKRIRDYFEEDVANANKLHKSLTAKRKAALDAVEVEIARLKLEMAAWKRQQDERDRQAELAAAAEAKRLEEERITAEAAALEVSGQHALAAAVIEQAIATPPPVIVRPSSVPQVAGVSHRSVWKWRVVNAALVPRDFLVLDEKKLTGLATTMKGTARVPGIQFYEDTLTVARSA